MWSAECCGWLRRQRAEGKRQKVKGRRRRQKVSIKTKLTYKELVISS
jgi:hypothetical protein